jgi:hypothetical protein
MEASISFWRAMRACHQSACNCFALSNHLPSASRGISHSCQDCFSPLFSASRSGSSLVCHCYQITSISALLAMDFSVMCGTRSYTNPWRMSPRVGWLDGALRLTSASFNWPSGESASR